MQGWFLATVVINKEKNWSFLSNTWFTFSYFHVYYYSSVPIDIKPNV